MRRRRSLQSGGEIPFERNSGYHRLFALKAAVFAARVLPLFEKERSRDQRPRRAVEAIRAWARGKRPLGMAEVRQLSLGAHAAARRAKSEQARFAARAAGQAVAVWHAPLHALAVPWYACKAVYANKGKGR